MALGASADDPLGGLDLDDPATLAELGDYIRAAAPALVVIDTVGMVTDRNLCRPEEARAFAGSRCDLNALRKLIGKGCPPSLALEIAL